MIVLLPPSEGKLSPTSGPELDLASLSFPELNATRSTILTALTKMCAQDTAHARAALKLSESQRDLISANAALASSACAPALHVYSGVLFQALALSDTDPTALTSGPNRLVIASALFGLVLPTDIIPAYRLSAQTRLPTIGALGQAWKSPIQAILESAPDLILDLRSAAYAALGPIPPLMASRSVVGRVLLEQNGKRTVVSHHNKATKGRLARAILEHDDAPSSVGDLPIFLDALGFASEIRPPSGPEAPETLNIVVYET